jgi:hypothetical protein
MEEHDTPGHEPVPLGQRLLDNPLLLLLLGLLVMGVFYTGWGLLEIVLLPKSTMP